MKKVTIIGVSDEEFSLRLGPALLALKADFMVEHLQDDAPQAHVEVVQPKALPEPKPKARTGPKDQHVHPSGKTLKQLIPEWITLAGGALHRDALRARMKKEGYQPNSGYGEISYLKRNHIICEAERFLSLVNPNRAQVTRDSEDHSNASAA